MHNTGIINLGSGYFYYVLVQPGTPFTNMV